MAKRSCLPESVDCVQSAIGDDNDGTERFNEHLALQLKAIAHPARLAILACLAERSQCCCGEVCQQLPLAQSTVSQHLDQMRRAGLIEFEQSGNRSHYRINRAAILALGAQIGGLAKPIGEDGFHEPS